MPLKEQKGQILLIVILVVIVASTIGLSIASRSITTLRTSTEEAESQKALAAAEAGIERAIQGKTISTGLNILTDNLSNNSTYKVDVAQGDATKFLVNGGNIISKDEGTDIWFVGHDVDGNPQYGSPLNLTGKFIHLFWGFPESYQKCDTTSAPAAMEVIAITRNPSTGEVRSYRYTYDSCSTRRLANNFAAANNGGEAGYTIPYINKDDGTPFVFGNRTPEGVNELAKNLSNVVLLRVIPIYKDSVVAIYTCNLGGGNCTSLPSQGYVITSTGVSGQASRKLRVFKGYAQTYLPFLSYGLFVAN